MCHVSSQENFWVTDHGKVVSIKCHNEQKFSAIIIFYMMKNIVKIVRELVPGGYVVGAH